MLILGRKINQSIQIGDDIRITITDVGRGKVAVGVDAPKDTPVHRSEVYAAIQRSKPTEGES